MAIGYDNPWEYPPGPDDEPATCWCGAAVTTLDLYECRTLEELHQRHKETA